jgi:ABC-type multidrug transport system fused ATPase/permease subunit
LYDGVDITRVPRKRLRQAVTIIPQDAVLFNGTVQTNLDPSATVPVEVLEKTLQSCSGIASFQYSPSDEAESDPRLSGENDTVTTTVATEHTALLSHAGGGGNGVGNGTVGTTSRTTVAGKLSLTTNVQPNGENFSHGQRQLLSLCRALIRKSKLMLLDEATASMDYETDSGVQAVLREELRDSTKDRFKARTLVTIAHRLRTIIDYDQVVVMGGGRVLETGTPRELYARGGQFTELVRHSGEGAELVKILEGAWL